jgi:two-component system, repressor protein LuxO
LGSFSAEAMAAMRAYAWPGNVRELVNVIRAVVALHDGPIVQWEMLPAVLRKPLISASDRAPLDEAVEELPWFAQTSSGNTAPAPLAIQTVPNTYDQAKVRPLGDLEREAVDYALRAFNGNVAQAAQALQVNPSTLYRKIQVWTAQGGLLKVQSV